MAPAKYDQNAEISGGEQLYTYKSSSRVTFFRGVKTRYNNESTTIYSLESSVERFGVYKTAAFPGFPRGNSAE